MAGAQVVPAPGKKGSAAAEGAALVEVGPRACLMPIRIFAGSFGGPVLYENPAYVSPNKARPVANETEVVHACLPWRVLQELAAGLLW